MSHSYPQVEMTPVYGICHAIFDILAAICFRGDIGGTDNLPTAGGFLLAANHASYVDPPLVGLPLSQQVCFFARKSLWKPGLAAWWLNAVGCIPVDRDGSSDVPAIKRAIQAVKQSKVIILFPEGTRSPDGRLQTPKPGVGLIACRTGATVIPARIFGSYDAFGRGGGLRLGTPVSITYGRPLTPADYDDPRDGKERYQRAAERIMAAISRLEPPRFPVI
jgi:1-acyl-sn-glycerol-3-phosphate acyltransferase